MSYKNKIKKNILEKYCDEITGIDDLIGDGYDDFSTLFYLFSNKMLYMLSNDPDTAILMKDVNFRRKIYRILKFVSGKMLGCTQIFEDRNKFSDVIDDSIYSERSDNPVIYVSNHGLRDDALATLTATKSHSYIFWGSLPLFFNTFDGLAASLVGEVLVNRKSVSSKKASIEKALKILELGDNLIIYPEGGWNKTSEKLVLDLWKGVYLLSKESKCDVVPVVHYTKYPEIVDKKNIIHTLIDNPISLYEYEEKEALILLRNVLATWQYRLMEEYGKTTRKEEMKEYENSDEAWDNIVRLRMSVVDRYDSSIETMSEYRPSDKVRPEDIFRSISNIKNINPSNIKMVKYAKKIVKEREFSDFQKRY